MRKWLCVPMMALLLLSACGGKGEQEAADLRDRYHDMDGCVMEAAVSCSQGDRAWQAELRCEYVPDGRTTVEVLSPETIAGVRALEQHGFRGAAMDCVAAAFERNKELGKK